MSRSIATLRGLSVSALLSLTLAACGGGGGSSGGGGGGGGGVGTLTLSVSQSTANFIGVFGPGGAPPPATVIGTVTGTGTGTLYIVISSSAPNVALVGNVNLGSTSGSADIIPASPNTVGLGNHTATITIKACINDATCASHQIAGSPKTVAVNYDVIGISSSQDSLNFEVGNAPVAADLSKAFNVDSFGTNGWTATVDLPMLALSPPSAAGNGSSGMTASIDPANLDALDSGTYTGSIQLASNQVVGVTNTTIPVTVHIARTRVNYVAPYVAFSGESREVIIRGEAFDAVTPTNVHFGNVAATSFTVVSPTEIHATHPALAVGTYAVHLDNDAGVDRTTADLHVVDPPTFTTDTVDYQDGPHFVVLGMLYDAERESLLVYGVYNQRDIETTRILRYTHSPSGWTIAASVPVAYDGAIALSIDGRKLYFAHPGILDELDPVTLTVTRSVSAGGYLSPHVYKLAVANDGAVIIQPDHAQFSAADLAVYNSRSHAFGTVLVPGPLVTDPPSPFSTGAIGASRDGGTVLMTHGYYERTARYVSGVTTEYVDTLDQRRSFISIELNRRGDVLLNDYASVWDGDLNKIGDLPTTTRTTVLAPEQPRIYAYDENQYDHSGTLRVYDPSLPATDGLVTEVTPAIPLPGDPLITAPRMTISPDGGTLFLAGYDQLIVLDVP